MSKSSRNKILSKQLRCWHRWCGLIVVLILFFCSSSGLLLVYKKELVHRLVTSKAVLPEQYSTFDIANQLTQIANAYGLEKRRLIKAPNWEEPYWMLAGSDGEITLLDLNTLKPFTHNLWVLEALSTLRALHTELLVGHTGEIVLLISGIAGLFLCLSGLTLWWPTRQGLRMHWVFPKSIKRSHLLHYHRHTGALSVAVMVILMLTGSLMLWQKLLGPILPPVEVTTLNPIKVTNEIMTPSELLISAHQLIPDGLPTYIRLNDDDSYFRFRLPNEWHPNGLTWVTINNVNDEVVISARSDTAGIMRKTNNLLYPLHSSYGMRAFYPLLVFLGGIAMLWIAGTGAFHYLRRIQFKFFVLVKLRDQ